MKEQFPGVMVINYIFFLFFFTNLNQKEMACKTFLTIAVKCKEEFVTKHPMKDHNN
jgi:hypothetical protein